MTEKNRSGIVIIILWAITIPTFWISCTIASILMQNIWPLIIAVISTIIVILLPMINVEYHKY